MSNYCVASTSPHLGASSVRPSLEAAEAGNRIDEPHRRPSPGCEKSAAASADD